MIPFDIKQLRVENVLLKSCTTAMGGSIRVVDQGATERTGKETYKRVMVPKHLIISFRAKHKTSRYFKPVLTALTYYGNQIVAMERHVRDTANDLTLDGLFGNHEWESNSAHNIQTRLVALMEKHQWFIDGRYIYTFHKPLEQMVAEGTRMDKEGMFRVIAADTVKLSELGDANNLFVSDRFCLVFTADGKYALTPPVWKQAGFGETALRKQDEQEKQYRFDAIDEYLGVNLAFALKAATELSSVFGYEVVEPLRLPELMVRLRTVNLPNVTSSVKTTYDIGLPFTHAIAWLIGLIQKATTLEQYIVLRNVLRYLTQKGIFSKNTFTPGKIFKDGVDSHNIPLMTTQEAQARAEPSVVDALLSGNGQVTTAGFGLFTDDD